MAIKLILKINGDSSMTDITKILCNSCFAFNDKLYTKLATAQEQFFLAEVLVIIISSPALFEAITKSSYEAFTQCLAWTLVYGILLIILAHFSVRRYASLQIQDLNNDETRARLCAVVRIGLSHVLLNEPESKIQSDSCIARRCVVALHACIPPRSNTYVNNLLILCNHPSLTKHYGRDFFIRLLFKCNMAPVIDSGLIGSWLQFNCPDPTLGSLSSDWRKSTLSALTLVLQLSPALASVPLNWAMDTLKSEDLSLRDLSIYHLPADQLLDHPHQIKRSGMTAEEKWEYELSLKRGPSPAQQKDIEAQRLIEADIRSMVINRVDILNTSLDIIEAVIESGTVDAFVPTIVDAILGTLGLFEGKIVKERCIRILRTLASMVGFDENIVKALMTAKRIKDVRHLNKFELSEMLIEMKSLESRAFCFIYPLLDALVHGKDLELLLLASDVLMEHTALTEDFIPRHAMAKSLVFLVENYPRLRNSGETCIIALAMAASDQEQDLQVQDVLVDGLINQCTSVRRAAIGGLVHLNTIESDIYLIHLYTCLADEELSDDASRLWEQTGFVFDFRYIPKIVALVTDKNEAVRTNAGKALCTALAQFPKTIDSTFKSIFVEYNELISEPIPLLDAYGMIDPASLIKADNSSQRSGIAFALISCTSVMTSSIPLIEFLINEEALGDPSSLVQPRLLSAGLESLDLFGKQEMKELLKLFDDYLDQPPKSLGKHDLIRESVVILMGTLARNMDSSDERIPQIITTLLETLTTPSESVQIAVAQCLPHLIKLDPKATSKWSALLMHSLFTSEKYGDRRGAAYGVAGLVKGAGISSLKRLNILPELTSAIQDKKNSIKREG